MNNQSCIFKIEELVQQYSSIYSFNRDESLDVLHEFKHLYLQRNDACFYWFFKYEDKNALLSFVIENEQEYKEYMIILQSWYREYKFKEHILFAMLIILIGIRRYPPVIPDIQDEYPEWKHFYMKNIQGDMIDIDEFVIDKHTRKGRRDGKDLSLFASEGAYVSNEFEHTNQEYKQIYTQFRQYNFSPVAKKSHTDNHQCEAVYLSGSKRGSQCTNTGKYSVDGRWLCGIHVKKSISTPLKLHYNIKYKIDKEEYDILFSSDTPRGQLLTGRHKKQVVIPLKGYIIKGPWTGEDIQRLNTMLFRHQVMKHFHISCIGFTIATSDDGNGYTIYKNLSTVHPSLWTYRTLYDKILQRDVKIVDRESMGIFQLNTLSSERQKDILFGDQFLFKGLIILALLNVGDVGFYNILVSDDVATIVDYEENTTRKIFNTLDNLLAKRVEKYTSLFLSGCKENVERIQQMIEEIDQSLSFINDKKNEYSISLDINSEWKSIRDVLYTSL